MRGHVPINPRDLVGGQDELMAHSSTEQVRARGGSGERPRAGNFKTYPPQEARTKKKIKIIVFPFGYL